jgi:hypothetical protein
MEAAAITRRPYAQLKSSTAEDVAPLDPAVELLLAAAVVKLNFALTSLRSNFYWTCFLPVI